MNFLKDFIYLFIFRERGREGERGGVKHQYVVPSHAPPTRDMACNPGMCPDWELNRQPRGSQSGTKSADPYQPGQHILKYFKMKAIHIFSNNHF